MSQEETTDFINKMSDPNSINIDNLVHLYTDLIKREELKLNTIPAQPSEEFQQATKCSASTILLWE